MRSIDPRHRMDHGPAVPNGNAPSPRPKRQGARKRLYGRSPAESLTPVLVLHRNSCPKKLQSVGLLTLESCLLSLASPPRVPGSLYPDSLRYCTT
eukprot:861987-Prymnesium_polylepis.1